MEANYLNKLADNEQMVNNEPLLWTKIGYAYASIFPTKTQTLVDVWVAQKCSPKYEKKT